MGSRSFHFVLVHGMGHGAWCWYKVTALLEAAGQRVTALDLASAGINKTSPDTITSIAEYLAPLTDFLAHSIAVDDQVILVGHSMGGSGISYAMEHFPEKIYNAIFLCSLMPLSGDYYLDPQVLNEGISLDMARLVNGLQSEHRIDNPTSIHLNMSKMLKILYNNCSTTDVSLAHACLTPGPIVVIKETLHLTVEKYGSIPRFYIRCMEDCSLPPSWQDLYIDRNPPQKVLTMPTSDHSPFFCELDALVELFLIIANAKQEHLKSA